MRSRRRHGLFNILCEWNGGRPVVSAAVFRNIMGNVRRSAGLTPTHGDKGELLLLVHRIRSMYLGVEAQRGEVASTGEDLCCFHFE